MLLRAESEGETASATHDQPSLSHLALENLGTIYFKQFGWMLKNTIEPIAACKVGSRWLDSVYLLDPAHTQRGGNPSTFDL